MAKGTIADSILNVRTLKLAHNAETAAGDIIVNNNMVLITIAGALINVAAAYAYMGKMLMPKEAPLVINVGDKVYFDASAAKVTKTTSGNTQCGFCLEAAGSTDTEVLIFLWPDADAIVAGEIADGAVTTGKLDDAAVTTVKITDANVTAAKLAADAVETAKIKNANVTLAKLAAGIAPSHICIGAGEFTTAGGDANESISVAGLVSTDRVIVSLSQKGSTPRTILTAAAGTGTIAVVMSDDPSTDHKITYACFRAVA